jgi:hypothetical protein
MAMSLQDAFLKVCEDAKPANGAYVSLYMIVPFYGGPEEGGWWGRDSHLVAYQWCPTEEEAERTRACVEAYAKELEEESRRAFGEYCNTTMEWLEARGLDADFLPPPDGETTYSVVVEDRSGSCESRGCRHYE